MSILISAHGIGHSFGARNLFNGISFSIESNERIGLIGPNGAGKSTLLKILAGLITADTGSTTQQRGLRVGYLEQVPRFKPQATIESAVLESVTSDEDWEGIAFAHEVIAKLSLSDCSPLGVETPVAKLSGGQAKRVALARELAKQPDLMLLDEPTNHLDVESILWIEDQLKSASFATVTITHDRVFLQRVSTRIIELDRRNPEGILSVRGDYATYLVAKEALITGQAKQEQKLRNTLRRETEWLQRGAKARSTKQQARINSAGELKDTVEELAFRNQQSQIRIDFQASDKKPKRMIEAKEISKHYHNKTIVPKLDLLITHKSRIGLLGANGCGKSTLIRMLIGKEEPDTGSIVRSDNLQVAYFEQNRDTLDPKTTLTKAVCPFGDHVIFQGNSVHVKSYLDRFLFKTEQMNMPVEKLSGGEQARLLIAKLMLLEANLLVLDEPTNDLDMATLDVLQDVLQEFNGAVILVTHDRYFLDQVCEQIIAFKAYPDGRKQLETFTGLEQWEQWHTQIEKELRLQKSGKNAPKLDSAPIETSDASLDNKTTAKKRKHSFKEQKELDSMESNIHVAEKKLQELEVESAKPEHSRNSGKLMELSKQMSELQAQIDALYARWSELEGN